ncbi:MAG: hypothetical protein B7Y41_12220 [Hydrogenophilales bacterium 28-61-23]|nr:MAG: hypothetical protein B7Y41_12220 [Hydrogenophilales bacterium 28-61-23]
MSFKHTTLAITLNSLLCISAVADAAYLERAQDLDYFYFGQRGLGLNQNGTADTDFGQLQPVSDNGVSLERYGQGQVGVSSAAGSSTASATQQLSIFPTDLARTTYLIDSFAGLTGSGAYSADGVNVTVKNDAFDQPAYADVWLQQSFRILPGPGESDGQAVRISISADTFLHYGGSDARLVQDAILDGLPGSPFKITYNGADLVTLPGAIHTGQNIYSGSFVGQIGDIIGFEGPTVFAHLTLPNVTFNSGEDWQVNVMAGFYGSVGVTPVPESETWAMLLVGLGLVGWALRRHG